MRHFIAAAQFISILPLGKAQTFEPPKMIPFFPIVGILLGILVALFDQVASRLWGSPVASLLDVIFLIILTGAAPATILAAVTPVPDTLAEYAFAGLLRALRPDVAATDPTKKPEVRRRVSRNG